MHDTIVAVLIIINILLVYYYIIVQLHARRTSCFIGLE